MNNVTMGCPRCGQAIGLFSWRCGACGTSPVEPVQLATPAPASKACTKCGTANPGTARFCGACGTPYAA